MNANTMQINVIKEVKKFAPRTLLTHALVWVVYIAFELSVLFNFGQQMDPWPTYVGFYAINIGLFYGLLWALGRSGDRLPLILIRCLSVLASYVILKLIINLLFYPSAVNVFNFTYLQRFVTSVLFRGYVFAFPAVFYWVARSLGEQKNKALESGRRLDRARAALLQQQLDPHFLFNTLSFVYEKVHRNSAEGAKALELLTDILHYTTRYTTADALTDVGGELEQIRNLAGIQDFRSARPSVLRITTTMDDRAYPIIPLILLTLTENIFKHGDLGDPEKEAFLNITALNGRVHYHSRNPKRIRNGGGSGVGLKNVALRLDHAYPGRYRLYITENELFFELQLQIDL